MKNRRWQFVKKRCITQPESYFQVVLFLRKNRVTFTVKRTKFIEKAKKTNEEYRKSIKYMNRKGIDLWVVDSYKINNIKIKKRCKK